LTITFFRPNLGKQIWSGHATTYNRTNKKQWDFSKNKMQFTQLP